jgi:hypothetical protein
VRVLGPEHPSTLNVRANLAHWTGAAGDAAGARDQYAELLPIYERVLGPEHPSTLNVRANLAHWTGEAGDAAGARDQYAELLPIYERVLGPEHPSTLTTRANLAHWTGAAGDAAGARDQLDARQGGAEVILPAVRRRWSVKTGADPDARKMVGQAPTITTIASLRALAAPSVLPPNGRSPGTEQTVWQVDASLVGYKRQSNGDYHLVIADDQGNTMIAKIPDPAELTLPSYFAQQIASARKAFDGRFGIQAAAPASGQARATRFITAAEPVTLQGLGFFDVQRGQTGVAPNAIELHPVISIVFHGPDDQGRARASVEESEWLRKVRALPRWKVRSGADPDARKLVGQAPTTTAIASLTALAVPAVLPPEGRSPGAEQTVWQLDATLTSFNRQWSGDYHLNIADDQGNTMIAKIPDPEALAPGSFFAQQIAAARQAFDSYFGIRASSYGPGDGSPYVAVAVPVTLQGPGFFDFVHGQRGVAPNGIELHPIISIVFRGQAPAKVSDDSLIRPHLSPREQEILIAVGNGASHKEIAQQLGISMSTVQTHLERIRYKYAAVGRPIEQPADYRNRLREDSLVRNGLREPHRDRS